MRVSVRYVLWMQEAYSDLSLTRRAQPAPIQGKDQQAWDFKPDARPTNTFGQLGRPRQSRVATTNGPVRKVLRDMSGDEYKADLCRKLPVRGTPALSAGLGEFA